MTSQWLNNSWTTASPLALFLISFAKPQASLLWWTCPSLPSLVPEGLDFLALTAQHRLGWEHHWLSWCVHSCHQALRPHLENIVTCFSHYGNQLPWERSITINVWRIFFCKSLFTGLREATLLLLVFIFTVIDFTFLPSFSCQLTLVLFLFITCSLFCPLI